MERSIEKKAEDYHYVLKCYNQAFSGPEGQVVLEHILTSTGVFDAHWPDDPGSMALRNFGAKILQYAGMEMPEVIPDVIKGIVRKSSEIKPETVRARVEQYLRSGGETS